MVAEALVFSGFEIKLYVFHTKKPTLLGDTAHDV
jgi:hypothetical protein